MTDYRWNKWQQRMIDSLSDSTPRYVKTHTKHEDGVYLIKSEEDLVELLIEKVKEWSKYGYLPNEEWYSPEEFPDYFQEKMGLSLEEYAAIVKINPSTSNQHILNLINSGIEIKRQYYREQEELEDAAFFKEVIDGNLGNRAGKLLSVLSQHSWNHVPMFEFTSFDGTPPQ